MKNGKSLLCLFGVLLSARITLQASSASAQYYVGAVVEYHPVTEGDNGTVIATTNARNYVKFLSKANEHEVDIVVFPESSLTTGKSFPLEERSSYLPHSSYVPDPKDRITPCKNSSSPVMQALKGLSCAAKQYATYVVINVREKAKCTVEKVKDCAPDGHELYNTNVVFDRQGMVVARYRKYNLFGEPGFNKTATPEKSTFRTDFNVTFGQFVCFDVLFEDPAVSLVRDSNVRDIAFPSHWFSELPFLVSPAVQASWAYANNVNFLGAGYNDPKHGSSGSGIYAGRDGSLGNLWTEKRTNAIIIAKIPKSVNGRREARANPQESIIHVFGKNEISTIEGNEPVPQQKLKADEIVAYTTQVIQPTNGSQTAVVCDRGLCCEFMVDTLHHNNVQSNVKRYRYRFAVFNGVRSFDSVATGGIEVCAVVSCTDDTPESCNTRFDINEIIVHPLSFNSIVISGNFTVGPKVIRMPIAMNTDLQPLNVSDFTYASRALSETQASIKFTLTKPRKGLMTFGIWGRNFTLDGSPKTSAAPDRIASTWTLMLVALVAMGIGGTFEIGPVTPMA